MLEINGKEFRIDRKLVRIGYLDGEGYQFLDDPETELESLRSSRQGVDIFTFIQRLSDTAPKHSYPMEMGNMATIRVSTFDEWMTKQIGPKVRNMVRKSAKSGVEIREVPYDDAFVRGISAVYNESPIRQGMKFWHYGKDLETVRRINGTFMDRSIFIGAYFEGNLIGFIKMVTDKDRTQAGLMQVVSMIGQRDKAPQNALIAQAVRSCADRGIGYLWYANMSYGKKQRDGLADFKRYNGFQKIEVPRYYVPLTIAGRVALRFGLHRSMADWVPESVASTYRRVRKQWYERKFGEPKRTEQGITSQPSSES